MDIRVEEIADWSALYAICEAAFRQSGEADLVRRLHDDGELTLSLVAYADKPAGHVAFSRLTLHGTPDLKGCALAPLAVAPEFQRQGVGSVLVRLGIERLRADGYDLVLVLGEPDYYARFGFTPGLATQMKTPYEGPYLQALALSERGKNAHGPVSYARAFAELK
ncbi:GNAT family N-acetyltransferase [Microvirga makkahensis]|uniref:GNAT family N-acetyltransferase n=1 Tax=Microvirga makkahensis TaxID=1128670 RepID=A0A7X3MR98_9HYPH|nr:N-acetyltransferase [Microvirga makkahensis]MXQ11625.1 GNAT family N-acetyltransferase [Microvirga makkahensis]